MINSDTRLKTEVLRFIRKTQNIELVKNVLEFSEKNFPDLSQNIYVEALEISKIVLNELNLKDEAIAATFLYIISKNQKIEIKDIRSNFSSEISDIIDGLYRINNFQTGRYEKHLENFIKLILTVSSDIRSIYIKIAEQLYYFRVFERFDTKQKEKIASQNQLLYSQLAHRLGLYNIKTEMEEVSMRFFHPEIYQNISNELAASKDDREKYIQDFIKPLKILLKKNNITADIKGRSKAISSIWSKMKRQGVGFEKVYDTFAIRIIIDCDYHLEKAQCWQTYSFITDKYKPNPKRLRDWISAPKTNGYESLHTTVFGNEGKWVEVQIRTKRMDEIAEMGHAAHWKYKEYSNDKNEDNVFSKIRSSLEESIEKEIDNQEKSNLYSSEIFIFSPQGDIYKMKNGDTILDFAFAIHTNLGSKCASARVNGRHVSYKEKLQNGDTVEIITNNLQRPTREWIKIANSSRTRNKIQRIIKKLEFKWSSIGKEKLQQKFKNLNLEFTDVNIRKLEKYFDCSSTIELFQGIGEDKFDIQKIKKILFEEEVKKEELKTEEFLEEENLEIQTKGEKYLYIDENIDSLDYSFAKCCNPIPGDEIIAFISIGKGAKIHRKRCSNVRHFLEKYPYRVVQAKWRKNANENFEKPVTVMITGNNKDGIASSITNIISNELKLKLRSINIKEMKGNSFKGFVTVDLKSKEQLNKLIIRLQKIKDIVNVGRIK